MHERLGVVHALIGEFDAALERYQAALTLLRQQPDAPMEGLVRLHHHIARVYGLRANFETALDWIERAIELAGDVQSLELARCLSLGVGLLQRQGRYAQAVEWGEQALRLTEQSGNLRDHANTLRRLGGTYRNLGNNVRAFELLNHCLELYQQTQDLAGLADAYNDLANVCYNLGQMVEARTYYEAGAEIKQAIGDIYGQGLFACNLGGVLKLQGNLDEAITQYQHSLRIYEQIGSLYMTGLLHMNLGATYLQRGDLQIAEEHLGRAAALFGQAGAEDFLPELEGYIAELHMYRGDLPKARLACELSLTNAARLEARTEAGATRRVLGQILGRSGDPMGAWQELQHSLAILREVASLHEIARTLVALADLAPALGYQVEGQTAIDEAFPILVNMGAKRDMAEARAVAARHGYASQRRSIDKREA